MSAVKFDGDANATVAVPLKPAPSALKRSVRTNVFTCPATRPPARNRSPARAAKVATASCNSIRSVTGAAKLRDATHDWRAWGWLSRAKHARPNSSAWVRAPVTPILARTQCSGWRVKSRAVVMPKVSKRLAQRRPTPHTSPTGVRAKASCTALVSPKTKTPPWWASFFARSPASLARVLVGAMPTDTGIPVHRLTWARKVRA